MKRILIILFLFPLMNSAHGQLSGDYVADFKEKVEYYLSFLNDGQYYMEIIVHETNDILDNRTLSIGHYSIDGETLLLEDKVHNFKMELDIIKDSLKIRRSFCLLDGKTFGFKSSYVDTYTLNALKDYDSSSVNQERIEYKTQNQRLYPLAYDDYLSMDCIQCSLRYRLTINKEKTYRLYFRDLLFSEGYWKREGVELILFDTSLNHKFYLMIGDKVLISILLPSDYLSLVLQRGHSKCKK